jgi:hypothetical protein
MAPIDNNHSHTRTGIWDLGVGIGIGTRETGLEVLPVVS